MRYLINDPIDGLAIRDGEHVTVHLEAGGIFTLSPRNGLKSRLIEATWDGDPILLFADDLDAKCERIAEH
jgi:hypothetical protein